MVNKSFGPMHIPLWRKTKGYWACECGASPMNIDRPDTPPEKCTNRYCDRVGFRWVPPMGEQNPEEIRFV
jgi:hypothetical protein